MPWDYLIVLVSLYFPIGKLGRPLIQLQPKAFGHADHLVQSGLQQPAVNWVRDGLLLDRGIHDHALGFLRRDGLAFHRRVDGGLQQKLQSIFTVGATEAADLGGLTRQLELKMLQTAEVLVVDVLAPALHEFLVAQVEAFFRYSKPAIDRTGKRGRLARLIPPLNSTTPSQTCRLGILTSARGPHARLSPSAPFRWPPTASATTARPADGEGRRAIITSRRIRKKSSVAMDGYSRNPRNCALLE